VEPRLYVAYDSAMGRIYRAIYVEALTGFSLIAMCQHGLMCAVCSVSSAARAQCQHLTSERRWKMCAQGDTY